MTSKSHTIDRESNLIRRITWSRVVMCDGVRWSVGRGRFKFSVIAPRTLLDAEHGRDLVAPWLRQNRTVLRDMSARHG